MGLHQSQSRMICVKRLAERREDRSFLRSASMVFVGGKDPYMNWKAICAVNVDKDLKALNQSGCVLVGMHTGAMLLGKYAWTAQSDLLSTSGKNNANVQDICFPGLAV